MKKPIALLLLALALAGFFGGNMLKDRTQVFEKRIQSTTASPVAIALDPGAAHTVFIWAVDEDTGYHWASVDARVTLRDAAGVELVAGPIQATQSEAKGGVKRAQNGFDTVVSAGVSAAFLTVELIEGDYVDVEIYADLPTWLHLAPGISILVGLVGLVLYLRSRSPAN